MGNYTSKACVQLMGVGEEQSEWLQEQYDALKVLSDWEALTKEERDKQPLGVVGETANIISRVDAGLRKDLELYVGDDYPDFDLEIQRDSSTAYLTRDDDFNTNHANAFIRAYLRKFYPMHAVGYCVIHDYSKFESGSHHATGVIVTANGDTDMNSERWVREKLGELTHLGYTDLASIGSVSHIIHDEGTDPQDDPEGAAYEAGANDMVVAEQQRVDDAIEQFQRDSPEIAAFPVIAELFKSLKGKRP